MSTTLSMTPLFRFMPGGANKYRSLKTVLPSGTTYNFQVTTTAGGTELGMLDQQSGYSTPTGFYSEQVLSSVTISGAITVNLRFTSGASAANATMRVKIFKVTGGGSDIETLVAQGDGTAAINYPTVTTMAVTATPASPIAVGPGEQFILRLYVIPAPGLTMAAGQIIRTVYGSAASTATVVFTEAISFDVDPNIQLWLRSTTNTGLGSFMDLALTRGPSMVTAVVNTQASGTEIQWTKTAGGAVAEWISARFKKPWRLPSENDFQTNMIASNVTALESNALANVTLKYKLFRRKTDGTEVLEYTKSLGGEIGTATSNWSITSPSSERISTPIYFYPDERLILRMYIANAGTMAAGYTATLQYDGPTASAAGDTHFDFRTHIEFKAESDPPEPVPDTLTTTGVG